MTPPWPIHDIRDEMFGVSHETPDLEMDEAYVDAVVRVMRERNARCDFLTPVFWRGYAGLLQPVLWSMQTNPRGFKGNVMVAD